jgi:hypothetical protein
MDGLSQSNTGEIAVAGISGPNASRVGGAGKGILMTINECHNKARNEKIHIAIVFLNAQTGMGARRYATRGTHHPQQQVTP